MPEFLVIMMKQPPMFGGFHICAAALSLIIPFLLTRHFPPADRKQALRRLTVAGWILVLLEVYKQVFLYAVVNGMHYNYWFFPFQLCSAAMYLCILLPAVSRRMQDVFLTFLFDFSLPGALLALLFPNDFLRESLSLTLHGFLWHAILVYIALTVYRAGLIDCSRRGYLHAALLYLVLAGIAVGLNLLLTPLAVYGSKPNLFYLSPIIKTGQIFFRDIAEQFGIPAEMVIYVTLYLLFCALFHFFAGKTRPGFVTDR